MWIKALGVSSVKPIPSCDKIVSVIISHTSSSSSYLIRREVTFISELVQKNSHLPDIEEDVMFRCVSNVWSKVLSYYTVPVWRVFLIKETLQIFGYFLLGLFCIYCSINLLFYIIFHILFHFTDNPGDIALCHLLNVLCIKLII